MTILNLALAVLAVAGVTAVIRFGHALAGGLYDRRPIDGDLEHTPDELPRAA